MQKTRRSFKKPGAKFLRTLWLAGIVLSLAHLSACGGGEENESAADQELRPEIIEAFKFFQEKNYERALSAAFALVTKDPEDAEAISIVSLVYLKQDRLEGASNLAKKSIGIDPNQSLPHNVLARVNFQTSRFQKALELARRALIMNPQDPLAYMAYRVIGEVYIRRGLIKDALIVLREAVKLEPEDPEILNLLGSGYIKDKQYDHALPILHKAEKIDPEFAGVHLNLALVYANLENGPKSIKHIDKAERLYTLAENKPWMAKSRDMRRVIAKQFKMKP